jgi:hypothetical protein
LPAIRQAGVGTWEKISPNGSLHQMERKFHRRTISPRSVMYSPP